ncbi:CRISPR-associated protein Cas8c/Csd1, subtype I-C/DVULG [Opitutaceae bacterium TAV1]|nr:CRISPR-associated protein Cas8c/Csd1, subtype I-C/DVULG [Opitutaceae bacterium TAV1]
MILHVLDSLYDRLSGDSDYGIASPGYSTQKISFSVVIRPDGSLVAIEDARDISGKKPVARQLLVPGDAKPPGQGINPCFLWDNSGYMLGYKKEDPKPERTAETFSEFRKKHLALEQEIDAPEFSAVCRFLEKWSPEAAIAQREQLDECASTGFGIFQLQGVSGYVHETSSIRSWWDRQQGRKSDGIAGQCLVSGEETTLAALHDPAIKGVAGAQSAGAKIVSFNCTAFTSYGKDQGYNAPVSARVAFRYTNALNALLSGPQSPRHRVQIGDATTVFWTEIPTITESVLAAFLSGDFEEEASADSKGGKREKHTPPQDDGLVKKLKSFMDVLRQGGGALPSLGDEPATKFYILGLSPNASRLSLRFWYADTLGAMIAHLKAHYDDLAIQRARETDPEFPALWMLLRQTARESKDIPPLLSGPLMRAILTGGMYPNAYYNAVINRIRADREISYLRAAIIKAFLNRNHRYTLPMSLDPERKEPAYLLGRLFAALEKTQRDALGDINAGIRDRFYSAASATPGSVFPRLMRTYQHHLAKLEGGIKVNREKLVQEIYNGLKDIPKHLPLEAQGLFAVGYYHQTRDFYTKRDAGQPAASVAPAV